MSTCNVTYTHTYNYIHTEWNQLCYVDDLKGNPADLAFASRHSRRRDTVKLIVCVCVCVCVYSQRLQC